MHTGEHVARSEMLALQLRSAHDRIVQQECSHNQILAQARAKDALLEAANVRNSELNAEMSKWKFSSRANTTHNPLGSVDVRPEHVFLSPDKGLR